MIAAAVRPAAFVVSTGCGTAAAAAAGDVAFFRLARLPTSSGGGSSLGRTRVTSLEDCVWELYFLFYFLVGQDTAEGDARGGSRVSVGRSRRAPTVWNVST